jgi:hypothetical protein
MSCSFAARVPAVRTRPRWRKPPGKEIINRDSDKPRNTNGHACAHCSVPHGEPRLMHAQDLGDRFPAAQADMEEPQRGAHVRLLLSREVAHDAPPIQNFGSIPSSWIE